MITKVIQKRIANIKANPIIWRLLLFLTIGFISFLVFNKVAINTFDSQKDEDKIRSTKALLQDTKNNFLFSEKNDSSSKSPSGVNNFGFSKRVNAIIKLKPVAGYTFIKGKKIAAVLRDGSILTTDIFGSFLSQLDEIDIEGVQINDAEWFDNGRFILFKSRDQRYGIYQLGTDDSFLYNERINNVVLSPDEKKILYIFKE